jgi:hypothetical protein
VFLCEIPKWITFDSPGGAALGKKTAPRGTFGVLDLPEKRFTVHMAADGTELRLATAKTGVVDNLSLPPKRSGCCCWPLDVRVSGVQSIR